MKRQKQKQGKNLTLASSIIDIDIWEILDKFIRSFFSTGQSPLSIMLYPQYNKTVGSVSLLFKMYIILKDLLVAKRVNF